MWFTFLHPSSSLISYLSTVAPSLYPSSSSSYSIDPYNTNQSDPSLDSNQIPKKMDACFLSSSSSILPTIKSIPYTNRFIFSNPRLPKSSICCQSGNPSSSSDECIPRVTGDWRSFRARLVATELTSSPSDIGQSASEDPDAAAADRRGQITPIGDKWAHSLHEPERGCLLVASEKLDGVHIFERTVILLLSVGPVGPTGIILNRPSLMSIKETRSSIFDVAGTFSERPLNFGGPLEEGLFLVGPNSGPKSGDVGQTGVFEEVMKGIYYGTKESVGCAAEIVKRSVVGVDDFRFFDGYCGWEKEQLQEEIRAGYWTVAACSPSVIGLNLESHGLWDEVLGLMGPKKVCLQSNKNSNFATMASEMARDCRNYTKIIIKQAPAPAPATARSLYPLFCSEFNAADLQIGQEFFNSSHFFMQSTWYSCPQSSLPNLSSSSYSSCHPMR
ncbi:hypothetical protein V2J09_008778 [Rumex salicifolius]